MWLTQIDYEARRQKKHYENVAKTLSGYQAAIAEELRLYASKGEYGAKNISDTVDVDGPYYERFSKRVEEWNQQFHEIWNALDDFQADLSKNIENARGLASTYASKEYYEVWVEDKKTKEKV